jgi:hypothetical protein
MGRFRALSRTFRPAAGTVGKSVGRMKLFRTFSVCTMLGKEKEKNKNNNRRIGHDQDGA